MVCVCKVFVPLIALTFMIHCVGCAHYQTSDMHFDEVKHRLSETKTCTICFLKGPIVPGIKMDLSEAIILDPT